MSLVGREREEHRLAALAASGGCLQIVGEPGVGKSALLSTLSGHRVVGVEAERDLPYAGLHQVLHPFLDLSTLSSVRRGALEVVFGLSDGAAPPVHLVGLAALDLLSGAVVLVDDAHWLDQASQDVLGFVARRLTDGVLVVTSRKPLFEGVCTLSLEPLAFTGTDENAACLLEQTADRELRRGGAAAAIRALENAARLGEDRGQARRWLRAAELAAEAGRREDVERILLEVRGLDLTLRERALVTWLPSAFDDGVGEGAAGPGELVGLAEAVVADGDVELGMRIFWSVAMRCFWVEPGTAVRERIAAVAARLPIDPCDPRMIAMAAYVRPVEQGDSVIAAFRNGMPDEPATCRLLGSAALQVGAFEESVRFSVAAQREFRAQGQFGLLARSLAVEAWSRTRLGDIATAEPAAEEAAKLAEETHQPYMLGLAKAVQAEIAALKGNYEEANQKAAEAERIGLAAGARPVLATVQLARSLAALGEGRYADAFAAVRRIHDPADPAYQLALRRYVLPELAEAATRSGNQDEACKIVEELDTTTSSPALASGLRYARALLAPDDEAEARFTAALEAKSSPWDRARTHLAFGAWLRRQRKATQARPHLKAAAEAFEAFGTKDWAERAREELRASGESRNGTGELTEHELTVARMAADGLTNKEIGERLHLSHRTVSTHLHRIFPKLGVTARAELKQALMTYDDTVT
ncbi:LuxR C-terminal-related transcriptional regulator [Lentzea sp. NPDC051838]|uniref:helix-turn-helix transcriptional regulator n=1 Tax=Lentzea sp. NPDC051838 TaxID=3154849 RepID=UPI00342E3B32